MLLYLSRISQYVVRNANVIVTCFDVHALENKTGCIEFPSFTCGFNYWTLHGHTDHLYIHLCGILSVIKFRDN